MHGLIDEVGVWWGLAQGGGEEGKALEVEDLLIVSKMLSVFVASRLMLAYHVFDRICRR